MPRQISLLSILLILHGHLYATGGWLATGVGSGLLWFNTFQQESNFIIVLVGGLFLFLGLMGLRSSYGQGFRAISLIRNGSVAYGKLVSSAAEYEAAGKKISKFAGEKLGISEEDIEKLGKANFEKQKEKEPQNIVMDYVFSFSTQFGGEHTVKAKIKYIDKDRIEDEAEELILYDENTPRKAVVYDAISHAPEILPDGNLGPADMSAFAVLILPVVILMMNGLILLYYLQNGMH